MNKPSQLFAFVHIEKAAGTTFIHILRRHFFCRYVDVRPLTSKGPDDVFSYEDLVTYRRINPWISCIAGHAVRPFSDLGQQIPRIRYVTLLREPSERYISQFIYWNDRLGRRVSFEQFLALVAEQNFQTKKICGQPDWRKAVNLLSTRFFCVGIMEKFDLFLVTLARKLGVSKSRLNYEKQNIGVQGRSRATSLLDEYREQIRSVNEHDYELYRFVKSEILPDQAREYGETLEEDVADFVEHLGLSHSARAKARLDWISRKYYVEPITNQIRRNRGLPAKGSYARS